MKLVARLIPALAFVPLLALVPMIASAQVQLGYFSTFAVEILDLIQNFLVPFVFALATIVFLWGVFTYFILGADNEEKRATGRSYMLYAIIGFVFMVALWGIVSLLVTIFGFTPQEDVQIVPNVPITNP